MQRPLPMSFALCARGQWGGCGTEKTCSGCTDALSVHCFCIYGKFKRWSTVNFTCCFCPKKCGQRLLWKGTLDSIMLLVHQSNFTCAEFSIWMTHWVCVSLRRMLYTEGEANMASLHSSNPPSFWARIRFNMFQLSWVGIGPIATPLIQKQGIVGSWQQKPLAKQERGSQRGTCC